MPSDNLYKPMMAKSDPRRMAIDAMKLIKRQLTAALHAPKREILDTDAQRKYWDEVQELGFRAASRVISTIQSGKLQDTGWDARCCKLEKFMTEFVDLSPAEFERRLAIERAAKVITKGGQRLARKLYVEFRSTGQSPHGEPTEAEAAEAGVDIDAERADYLTDYESVD